MRIVGHEVCRGAIVDCATLQARRHILPSDMVQVWRQPISGQCDVITCVLLPGACMSWFDADFAEQDAKESCRIWPFVAN